MSREKAGRSHDSATMIQTSLRLINRYHYQSSVRHIVHPLFVATRKMFKFYRVLVRHLGRPSWSAILVPHFRRNNRI